MRLLRLFLIFWMTLQVCSGSAWAAAEWYLESNMLSLDASNRYVGAIVASNSSNAPVYVRATVTQLGLKEGQRVRSKDEAAVLKVSPTEFVIKPRESFRLRLLADVSKLNGPNASYYVKLEDASLLIAQADPSRSGMASGFLLAYEALVNINTDAKTNLSEKDFSLKTAQAGKLALTNLSRQHVYLERGNACPDRQTLPVDCAAIADFPKQSLLPGETLLFSAATLPYLAILVQPKLNFRIKPDRIYLPMPAQSASSL